MGQPVSLPPAFDGMFQDFPRNALPKGKAWNMVDYIPRSLGAPLTERGGWTYASPSLATSDTAATYTPAVVYAPFSAGSQLLAINDTGNLCKITDTLNATKIGAAGIPSQRPVLLHDKLFIPSADGSTAGSTYDGTSITTNGVDIPVGKFADVYANRLWISGSQAHPQRVYASGAGDVTSWDISTGFLDVSAPVFGVCALPSVLLVFTADHAVRFRGTTPPPGTDITEDDPVFHYGCTDARSIAVNGSNACFANANGVYLTDGSVTPTDLTEACGIKKHWRDLLATYNFSTWTLAGGWFGNLYFIAVMNGATFIDAIVFDPRLNSAYRISNLDAAMLASASQVGDELYAGSRGEARVYALSRMLKMPATQAQENDGDGTAVTAVWESPFYEASQIGSQRWRDAYLEYDLQPFDRFDTPTMTLSYITSPEQTAYTALTPDLGETTGKTTSRLRVGRANVGLGFKVSRSGSAFAAKLYVLGATVASREGSRR